MSETLFTVPSTLLTWATLTNFVRGVRCEMRDERSSWPSSVMGKCLTTMPRFWACNCQETMFEWCSISVTSTSSPACICDSQNDDATRLMASVVPRVKTISSVFQTWNTGLVPVSLVDIDCIKIVKDFDFHTRFSSFRVLFAETFIK